MNCRRCFRWPKEHATHWFEGCCLRADPPGVSRTVPGRIRWDRPAREVVDRVRAFVPWPGSHTTYRGEPWKVVRARVGESHPRDAAPGEVLRVDGDSLLVAAGEGSVRILALQVPGGRPMSVQAYLNGHPVARGEVLGRSGPDA